MGIDFGIPRLGCPTALVPWRRAEAVVEVVGGWIGGLVVEVAVVVGEVVIAGIDAWWWKEGEDMKARKRGGGGLCIALCLDLCLCLYHHHRLRPRCQSHRHPVGGAAEVLPGGGDLRFHSANPFLPGIDGKRRTRACSECCADYDHERFPYKALERRVPWRTAAPMVYRLNLLFSDVPLCTNFLV